MSQIRKRGLGKGLTDLGINELLSDLNQSPSMATADHNFKKIPIDILRPGKYQPRKDFKPEALQELADSIKSQGIIQPLVVRALMNSNYEIIAGERRWRAAQLAGLSEVPVIVREISDHTAMAMALIENIQREDLHPLEEANALNRLIHEFSMTHEQAAEVVGKARVTVTNILRLLQLNPDVKMLLEQNAIEMGHAKVLLGLTGFQQSEAAKTIANKKLTVREAEQLVRKLHQPSINNNKKPEVDPNITSLQKSLSERLAASVLIQHQNNGKGQLLIRYNSLEELEGILAHIR